MEATVSQVRLCRLRSTGEVYAMKKLKKTDMLSRGQVPTLFFLFNVHSSEKGNFNMFTEYKCKT